MFGALFVINSDGHVAFADAFLWRDERDECLCLHAVLPSFCCEFDAAAIEIQASTQALYQSE